jgi:hypothetical protein
VEKKKEEKKEIEEGGGGVTGYNLNISIDSSIDINNDYFSLVTPFVILTCHVFSMEITCFSFLGFYCNSLNIHR